MLVEHDSTHPTKNNLQHFTCSTQRLVTLLVFLSSNDRLEPFLDLLARRARSCLYFHQTFVILLKWRPPLKRAEERLTAADMDPLKALCFLSEGEQNKHFKRRCIACAVNVNEEYLLLTSSSAIKDKDKKENLIFKRFSRRHFGRYKVKALYLKEFGEFTFLKIKDTPQANGGNWSIDPLDLKLPSSENLKALTSPCATEKFKFTFKCDGESGTIEVITKKPIEETSIVGAPIVIKQSGQFSVIGVVGLTNEKQLCPCYLNADIFGEFCFVCAHLHLVGLIFFK